MSDLARTNQLDEVIGYQRETRARLRTRFEEEVRQNLAEEKMWIWGEWVPNSVIERVNRQIARRGLLIFLETFAAIFLLCLVATATWLLLCMMITPYPPNPRAGMVSGASQSQ